MIRSRRLADASTVRCQVIRMSYEQADLAALPTLLPTSVLAATASESGIYAGPGVLLLSVDFFAYGARFAFRRSGPSGAPAAHRIDHVSPFLFLLLRLVHG